MQWRPQKPIFACWVTRNAWVKLASVHSQLSPYCNTPFAATAADDLGKPRRTSWVCLRLVAHGKPFELVVNGPIATIEPRSHARQGAAGEGGVAPAAASSSTRYCELSRPNAATVWIWLDLAS